MVYFFAIRHANNNTAYSEARVFEEMTFHPNGEGRDGGRIIAFMNEDFELPVDYKGKEIVLTARLLQQGYTYKIEVETEAGSLLFEKDDEAKWRALIDTQKADEYGTIDAVLLQAIATSLETIFE
jgi:hypothetical protein